MQQEQNKTGILLSGGMDSIALAYWKKPSYAFTIDYGQKPAQSEIHAATQISKYLGMKHYIVKVDCSGLGSGDMNGSAPISVAPIKEWWPYRNQLLITLACMKGISLGINKMIIGSVSTDNMHKDGSEKFYSKISDLMKFQEGEIEIECPAINLNSVDLIKQSEIPVSLLFWAHSCHTSNQPCMVCNGCKKYLYVLQELGIQQ
jgi:7-cyano-7-deazaguanine synthase